MMKQASKKLFPFYLTVILLFVMLANHGHGQGIAELISKGDELYDEGDYFGASAYYYQVLTQDSTRYKIAYRYAESSRLFNEYREATRWYRFILRSPESRRFPDARFWLAMMLKNTGDYQAAIQHFEEYIKDQGGKAEFYQRAISESLACKWAAEAILDTLPFTVVHPGSDINSAYADFGAVQMGDSLLFFSSLQFEYDAPYESLLPGMFLTRIFQSRITPAGFSEARALETRINDKSTHNANLCFSSNHQLFFFSRCADERRPELRCELYLSKLKNGKFTRPVALPNTINKSGYTATQPAMAHGAKEDILFFVSDRPGGLGGKDIWFSVVRKGKVFPPANLGPPVNTPGNEITPFYDNKTGTLYFSSDGHKGFGGYDIFRSKGSYNTWSMPENVGHPLNTSYNDLYYTINETDSSGYLTSNRPGSYFIKKETCCNDIYQVYPGKKTTKEDTADTSLPEEPIPVVIRKLLPLSLYFHNDEPDPATTKESTDKNFRTTVADYYLLKKSYQEEYSRGLKGQAAAKAVQEIADFFEDYVLKGLQNLETFTGLLLQDLRQGNKIMITLKGFTSPLNTAEYNKSLARRRISSLINYFREYDNGILIPFLTGTHPSGGSLQFIEEPIGEEQASPLVSDNPSDKRKSVYSRAAALERRIQILYYNSR
ncbi:MAG TPA: hypothetical protein P5112_09005 [Bacteroidales bacterium]|nr:hypothetical protein [Bacteroidales bacterium]